MKNHLKWISLGLVMILLLSGCTDLSEKPEVSVQETSGATAQPSQETLTAGERIIQREDGRILFSIPSTLTEALMNPEPIRAAMQMDWTQEDAREWIQHFIGEGKLYDLYTSAAFLEDMWTPEQRYTREVPLEFRSYAELELESMERQWKKDGTVNGVIMDASAYEKARQPLMEEALLTPQGEGIIEGIADLGNRMEAYIRIEKDSREKRQSILYERAYINARFDALYVPDDMSFEIPIPTISMEEALQKAEDYLQALEIEGMELVKMEPYESSTLLAHAFEYRRSVQGKASIDPEILNDSLEGLHHQLWPKESILICVDDYGVCRFEWISPTQMETLNTPYPMMDEQTLLLTLEKELLALDIERFTDDVQAETWKVEIVSLTPAVRRIETATGILADVPVYECSGIIHPADAAAGDTDTAQILLTLHALDGSVITP